MSGQRKIYSNEGVIINNNVRIVRGSNDSIPFTTYHNTNDKKQLERAASKLPGYQAIEHGSWTVEGDKVNSKIHFVVPETEHRSSVARAMQIPGIVNAQFDKNFDVHDLKKINKTFKRINTTSSAAAGPSHSQSDNDDDDEEPEDPEESNNAFGDAAADDKHVEYRVYNYELCPSKWFPLTVGYGTNTNLPAQIEFTPLRTARTMDDGQEVNVIGIIHKMSKLSMPDKHAFWRVDIGTRTHSILTLRVFPLPDTYERNELFNAKKGMVIAALFTKTYEGNVSAFKEACLFVSGDGLEEHCAQKADKING